MKQAYVISFGRGGHTIQVSHTWRDGVTRTKGCISGYDTPQSFERALARGEKQEYPPLAGLPVLDKREVLKETPALSFRSPLVDVDLEDGTIDRLDTHAARSMLPGLSGGFEVLAASAIVHEGKPEPGPLDSVSVGDYIAWWRSRGAKLGRMSEDGLRIVWQDDPNGKEAP